MHIPVFLKETIELLDPQPGEFFIDGTVGSGGHAVEILKRIAPNGKLLGIDWDEQSLKSAKEKIEAEFKIKNSKVRIFWIHGNYADLPEILKEVRAKAPSIDSGQDPSMPLRASGLLIDLGFSSDQIEASGRGFSFQRDEPLDMRYDHGTQSMGHGTQNTEQGTGMTAAEVVNSFREDELADIFWKYGEERASRKIAKGIIEARRKEKIITTFQLVRIIERVLPRRGKLHPATKTFQALRIYVNHELENLEKAIKNVDKAVRSKGRVAIISFHSLEDRIVKNRFRDLEKQGKAKILTRKPIVATREEIQANPGSRSAKVRGIQVI